MTGLDSNIAGKNLKKFRKFLNINQQDFAKSVKMPQSHVSNIEKGVRNVTEAVVAKITNRYNELNVDWWFTSRGNMLIQTPLNDVVSEEKPSYSRFQNVLIPFEARARYLNMNNQQFIKQKANRVIIPNIQGDARTFEVRGDSMYPYIQDGDLVACTQIKEAYSIKAGEIYVIVSQQIHVKFATFLGDRIQLVSSSKSVYDPLDINLKDVREIWEVKYKITPHITSVNKKYDARFEAIERKLNKLLE